MTPRDMARSIRLLRDWLKVVDAMDTTAEFDLARFLPELRLMRAETRAFLHHEESRVVVTK